ncbi:MAG: NAD-dependent malic enzyme [Nitrospirales bacterium]|nr:NAD-dependent malic enzyme [Nitrospira sp.]MDR4499975.1 NAD-dependent malic enzyme [Nitrospirales bacterium]
MADHKPVVSLTGKTEFIRMVRYKSENQVGVLAQLMTAIAKEGGSIGDVKTRKLGKYYIWRDVTIITQDREHFARVLKAIRKLKETTILQIIDEVLERHQGGKIRMELNTRIETVNDMRLVYTPGVADVCRLLQKDPSEAYNYTWIHHTVALLTNGSRTLGLGNIGPLAAMPVMEGKAALFRKFTGYNMVPIPINTTDPQEFIDTAIRLSPGFGAIHLEDISAPECFEIETELVKRLSIPVMHDDQDGTAVVCLAAVINACRIVKGDLEKVQIGQVGLGAAGSAIARLIMAYTKRDVWCCDKNPSAVNRLEEFRRNSATLKEIMNRCDVVISTTGVEGLIKPDMVKPRQIILALTNPIPEITEEQALSAGAAFYSDGRYVNNLLAYPGIFKGALETRAMAINDSMLLAAVQAIVEATPQGEIVPSPLDLTVHVAVTKAVAKAAMASGVAQKYFEDDYFDVEEKLAT